MGYGVREGDEMTETTELPSLHRGNLLRLPTVTLLPFSVHYEILATVSPSLLHGTLSQTVVSPNFLTCF